VKQKYHQTLADKLSNTQGVVLRYVVTTYSQPVEPTRVINHIDWSPLPHSFMEAKRTLETLLKYKLVQRVGKAAFTHTPLGRAVIIYANNAGLWQAPIKPPPLAPKYVPPVKTKTRKRKKKK